MLKRLGISISIIILLVCCEKTYALSQYSAILTKIENSLFGMDYSTQNDDVRLGRIEKLVYGQTSSMQEPQRVNKLAKDLNADLLGQEIKPSSDTFAKDEDSIKEEDVPKADKSVSYPIVDSLEQKVFSKEFKTDDINQRLANLEQKIFKKTYDDDLSSRVDRLKAAVLPERVANNNNDEYSYNDDDNTYTSQDSDLLKRLFKKKSFIPKNNNYFPDPDSGSYTAQVPDQNDDQDAQSSGYASPTDDYGTPDDNPYNSQMQDMYPRIPSYNKNNSVLDRYPSDADIAIPLAALEKKIFKHSFPNDTVPNRLTRLELKIFNSAFYEDDEQTRIDRIASAYQAQKTSHKYDSNKFQQHMSTAVEIGAILLMILAAVL